MNNRISSVGKIKINTVGSASALEIGDSEQMTPLNYTIAIQREKAIFIQNEIRFGQFDFFSKPFLQPVIHEPVRMNVSDDGSPIAVKQIKLFLVSSSSIVHIGSSQKLNAQSRIKHIRHLLREEP